MDRTNYHSVSYLAGLKGWVHAKGYFGSKRLFEHFKVGVLTFIAPVRHMFVDVFGARDNAIAKKLIRYALVVCLVCRQLLRTDI